MNFDPYSGPMVPPSDEEIVRRTVLKPPKSKKIFKIIGITIAVLIALAGAGFGAIKVFHKKPAPAPVPVNTSANLQVNTEPVVKNDVPDATGTKPYENGPMGLKITYPSTWAVSETSDSGVRVESPTFIYTSLDNGDIKGNFRIYIRKGARASDGTIIGRGVAIQQSQKLTYTQPAPGQRTDTLMSLFGLDTHNNFGFFLIAGNFQLNPGDTLGPNYGKEPDTFIVSGGYSDPKLTIDMATHPVDPTYITTSKAYSQAQDILKMLQLL